VHAHLIEPSLPSLLTLNTPQQTISYVIKAWEGFSFLFNDEPVYSGAFTAFTTFTKKERVKIIQ
jgi:hypothetical protein